MKKLLMLMSALALSTSVFAVEISEYDTSVCLPFKIQPQGYSVFAKEIRITGLIADRRVTNQVGNKLSVELSNGKKVSTVAMFNRNAPTVYDFKTFNLMFNYVDEGGIPNSNIGEDIYDFKIVDENGQIKAIERMGCSK